MLRRFEALMIVADPEYLLVISGDGNVLETDDGIAANRQRRPLCPSRAKALLENTTLSAREIAEKALRVASESASTRMGTSPSMSFNKLALTLAAAALVGAAIPACAADPTPSAPGGVRRDRRCLHGRPGHGSKGGVASGILPAILDGHQRLYLADVQGLSSIDEGEATDKYVNDLETQSNILRKFEANAVTLALDDLVKIEGPERALQSITPLSQMLSAPLPSHKKKESKDKRVVAILATIDEVRTVQADLTALQFNLTPILKLQGGDEGLWAIELGRALASRRVGVLTKASLDAENKDVALCSPARPSHPRRDPGQRPRPRPASRRHLRNRGAGLWKPLGPVAQRRPRPAHTRRPRRRTRVAGGLWSERCG